MSVNPEPSADPGVRKLIELDVNRPNGARMYDYYLGGKNHYPADRAAAEEVLRIVPEARRMARDNRGFLGRAVRFITKMGIQQFLDIGTGLPAQGGLPEAVRQAAGEAAPGIRMVHVDHDRMVCAHARALLAVPGRSAVVEADLRHVPDIVRSRPVRELLDFDRPVAIVLTAVLHFLADEKEADEAVAGYRALMAPGSYLVLSHGTPGSLDGRKSDMVRRVYARSSSSVMIRPPERIAGFFTELKLVEPGLVDVARWRPGGPVGLHDGAYMIGGVARRDA